MTKVQNKWGSQVDVYKRQVLNGAFMFAADLMRNRTIPSEISFVKLASYAGTSSTGKVKELVGLNDNIEGRTVVIVDCLLYTSYK